MTRKDYVLIAAAIKARRDLASAARRSSEFLGGIDAAAETIAAALALDNQRFDLERFIKACGVQS